MWIFSPAPCIGLFSISMLFVTLFMYAADFLPPPAAVMLAAVKWRRSQQPFIKYNIASYWVNLGNENR